MAPLTPCFAISAPLVNRATTHPRHAAVCSPCRAPRLPHRTRLLRAVADTPTDPDRDPAPAAPSPVAAEPASATDDVPPAPIAADDDDDGDLVEKVPGKFVMSEAELLEQKRKLEKYAEGLRLKRLAQEREDARLFGWVKYAETMNGRFAMFFFLTGLLTEYWTGYTLPEQIELMLRTLGII